MKHDISADPSSWETRRVVAEKILGWKREETSGYNESYMDKEKLLIFRAPSGNRQPYYAPSDKSHRVIGVKPLPDFLHLSEWTGPLWIVLEEKCEIAGFRAMLISHSVMVTVYREGLKNRGHRFGFNREVGKLPNIAIAQAIQQIQEEK